MTFFFAYNFIATYYSTPHGDLKVTKRHNIKVAFFRVSCCAIILLNYLLLGMSIEVVKSQEKIRKITSKTIFIVVIITVQGTGTNTFKWLKLNINMYSDFWLD